MPDMADRSSWFSRRPRRRLSAAAALAVAVGIVAAVTARASSGLNLPPITPVRLAASTIRALDASRPIAGRMLTHVDVGVPSLPEQGVDAALGPARILSAISGDHRVRLWSSRDGFKVAELLPFSEISFTAGRTDAWAWDSQSFTAYHLAGYPSLSRRPRLTDLIDPMELARRTLQGLDPTTRVHLSDPERVAGREAYLLALEPRTRGTLVGRIEIAIDAVHRVPLKVAVFARGAGKPALSVAFASVSFDPVDPSVFDFTPPPGAKLRSPGAPGRPLDVDKGAEGREGAEDYGRVFGRGWTAVFAVRQPVAPGRAQVGDVDPRSFLPIHGPLFSMDLVERGDHVWLVYGAVPASRLAAVEPELP
jgi:hypothetical protein